MTDRPIPALLLIGAALLAALGGRPAPAPDARPAPPCPDDRCPAPAPAPAPRRPWGEAPAAPVGAYVGGEESKDGVPVQVRVPKEWHVRNRGGSDGAGLCVYASCRHTGLVQGDPVMAGMFEWMFRRPGGSYPAKLAKSIQDYAREKGLSPPRVLQVERADFELLKKACASGRLPGVFYSRSPTGRYGGQRISHMVSLPHCDGTLCAVLDNNYPGSYEWMSPEEARKAGVLNWCVILLSSGAPPAPRSD